MEKKNPLVTNYKSIDYFDNAYKTELGVANFMLAFGVEQYDTREGKDDPFFVEWQINSAEKFFGLERTTKPIKYHKCTDEDWAQFNPPRAS